MTEKRQFIILQPTDPERLSNTEGLGEGQRTGISLGRGNKSDSAGGLGAGRVANRKYPVMRREGGNPGRTQQNHQGNQRNFIQQLVGADAEVRSRTLGRAWGVPWRLGRKEWGKQRVREALREHGSQNQLTGSSGNL